MAEIVIPVASLILQVLTWALKPKQQAKQIPPKMPSSDYGRPIPFIYGTMRVAVNWIAPREDSQIFRTTGTNSGGGGKGGGGGGGGSSNEPTIYYLYLLGLICEGPVQIRQVKINNEAFNSSSIFESNSSPIKYLNGEINQSAPPLISSINSAPKYQVGYRKLALLQFQGFKLEKYGNSIPNNVSVQVKGFYLSSSNSKAENNKVKVKDICQHILVSSGIPEHQLINLIPDEQTCLGAIAQRGGEDYYSLLSQFLRCYFLYMFLDDDGNLVIKSRNQDSIKLTIEKTALMPIEENGELVLLSCKIGNDADLPGSFSLEFYDTGEDYDKNTVRAYNPNGNVENDLSFSVDIAMTSNDASLIAQNVLMQEWLESKYKYKFKLFPQYISLLKVGDIVQINPEQLLLQVTSLAFGADYTTEVEGVIYQNFDYLASLNIVTDTRPQNEFVDPFQTPTELTILDSSLLFDYQQDAGLYVYSNKPQSELYVSIDGGLNYPNKINISQAVYEGTALSVLGGNVSPFFFDNKNSITVEFNNGEVDQQTLEELYQEDTILFIGKIENNQYEGEFISFLNAELLSVNTYKISYLKRGLKGTERFINSHSLNEKVIVVKSPFFVSNRLNLAIGILYQSLFFKLSPTTFLSDLSILPAMKYTYLGNSFKTFAPHFGELKKASNGDLIISIFNRSRKYAELKDNTDVYQPDSPVSIKLEILDNNTVKRTFDLVNLSGIFEVTYSLDQQVSDFGVSKNLLTLNAYSISSVVGIGFNTLKTLQVTKVY